MSAVVAEKNVGKAYAIPPSLVKAVSRFCLDNDLKENEFVRDVLAAAVNRDEAGHPDRVAMSA